jgi:hypothetical protein
MNTDDYVIWFTVGEDPRLTHPTLLRAPPGVLKHMVVLNYSDF